MQDEEIIEWLAQRDGVWVHADDKAKIQHGRQVLTSRISTLWVRRPKTGMSGVSQLRAIIHVLEDYLARRSQSRSPVHYRVVIHGEQHRERVRLEPYSP